MNDSPHMKLVSGGYSAEGRDRSLLMPTLPDSDYICTKKVMKMQFCPLVLETTL